MARGLGQSRGWVAIDDVKMTFGSKCEDVTAKIGKEAGDESSDEEEDAPINPSMSKLDVFKCAKSSSNRRIKFTPQLTFFYNCL